MTEEKYCNLCENGKCVLDIKGHPKWVNVAGCKILQERRDKGIWNVKSEQS